MAEVSLDKTAKSIQQSFNKAFAAFERGNLEQAIDLFYVCLEAEPGLLQARKFAMAASIKLARQKKSSAFGSAMSMLGGSPAYLQGMTQLKSGKAQDALVTADKLLRKDPLNLKFVDLFQQAATAAGYPEAGVQAMELILEHFPNDPNLLRNLGALCLQMNRSKSARDYLERLCAIAPNDGEANKLFKDALARDSFSSGGWANMQEKGSTFRDAIKDKKEAQMLEQQSKAVKTDSDAEALIAEAEAKVLSEPQNVNAYRTLARLYSQLERFDDAVAALDKALVAAPGDPELDTMRSAMIVQRFDKDVAAMEVAGNVEQLEQKATERLQFIFDDLNTRVQRYPNDLKLRFDWGVMLYENDYFNEAVQQFQLAQKNPKFKVKSCYYLGLCFRSKSQFDMAEQQFLSALEDLPTMDATKKDVLYVLGEISEAAGDRAKAIGYYKQIYSADISFRDVAQKVEQG